jgi:hypothetical protein
MITGRRKSKFSTQFHYVDQKIVNTLITLWSPGFRGEKTPINSQNKYTEIHALNGIATHVPPLSERRQFMP